ncbi:MAG: PBSX family phage terminase large subunit [Alphaproteobacteria bacterium]
MEKNVVNVMMARAFEPLLRASKRYKFYYGGRAGGKSYAFADSALLKCRSQKMFVACVREIQDSIKDSVYKLLCDRINYYGFGDFKVFEDRIDNLVTGSRIIFKGLRDQNAQNIKSLEGVDLCWIEEGQTITRKSWEVLDPTIRKDGSEIWISMNREEVNDPLWMVLAANPDERTLVRKVNYYDNPYCPEEIRLQAEKCKKTDYQAYLHIWEGEPLQQGDYKLINADTVRRAMQPKMDASTSPLVIGLDIARAGSDRTVFCFRKGRWCYRLHTVRGFDTVEVADLAIRFIKDYQPLRLFLDLGNSGAGVYDILVSRGFAEVVRGVNFGGKAILSDRYKNRRAEMWDGVNQWLRQELPVQVPNDEELFDELVGIERVKVAQDQLQLEDKETFKKRLGRSPDKADALALTFAEPVFDDGKPKLYGNGHVTASELFFETVGDGGQW